jgi:hypothetical protein
MKHESAASSYGGFAVSNPVGAIYVRPLRIFCVFRYRSLQRADPSSRGGLLSVCVCVCVCH